MPKAGVEAFAENVARVLEFKPGGDIFALTKKLGGTIEYKDVFSDGDEDTIRVDGPGKFCIVLSDVSSDLRDRFTLAHELGHYFLHADQGERRIRAARRGSGRVEWEANWFAAGFLMPAKTFRDAARNDPDPILLAAKFRVSTAAARIRMESLGVK
jgi:predicted transcriptional regulator